MATYRAVTLDGQEHPPRDQWTLKQWYFARLIGPECLVLSSDLVEWTQLKNLFDLPQWEAEERTRRGLGPNVSVFKEASAPEPPRLHEARFQKPYKYERHNELGLRAGGVLMFVNAAITVVSLVLLALKPDTRVSSFWGFAVLLDMFMGYKLLTSDNTGLWKTLTLVRVGIGAALIGLVLMLIGPDPLMKLLGVMDLAFAASFFLVLIGQASRTRVTIGVATFAISTCAVIGLVAVLTPSGEAKAKLEIMKYRIPGRSIVDAASGSRMHLPQGWVLLSPDNPIVSRPYASMIAVHPDTHSFATLSVQQDHRDPSLDTALSTMVNDQRTRVSSLVEGERVNSPFGRLDGRKVAMTWKENGRDFKGWITVAGNGSYLIFLNEWCPAESYASSEEQFAALERGASAGEPQRDSWGGFPVRK